jgi:hypothetical protein
MACADKTSSTWITGTSPNAMRESFVQKRFGAEAQALIVIINRILADYEAQGYDLSLRQLYYQLVAQNIVPNTERSYKNVGNLVSDARLAGLIDRDMIKDRGRVMVSNSHWDNPANDGRDLYVIYLGDHDPSGRKRPKAAGHERRAAGIRRQLREGRPLMKDWTNNFLTYAGWCRWTAWDETQADSIGTYLFKWRARRKLRAYAAQRVEGSVTGESPTRMASPSSGKSATPRGSAPTSVVFSK